MINPNEKVTTGRDTQLRVNLGSSGICRDISYPEDTCTLGDDLLNELSVLYWTYRVTTHWSQEYIIKHMNSYLIFKYIELIIQLIVPLMYYCVAIYCFVMKKFSNKKLPKILLLLMKRTQFWLFSRIPAIAVVSFSRSSWTVQPISDRCMSYYWMFLNHCLDSAPWASFYYSQLKSILKIFLKEIIDII